MKYPSVDADWLWKSTVICFWTWATSPSLHEGQRHAHTGTHCHDVTLVMQLQSHLSLIVWQAQNVYLCCSFKLQLVRLNLLSFSVACVETQRRDRVNGTALCSLLTRSSVAKSPGSLQLSLSSVRHTKVTKATVNPRSLWLVSSRLLPQIRRRRWRSASVTGYPHPSHCIPISCLVALFFCLLFLMFSLDSVHFIHLLIPKLVNLLRVNEPLVIVVAIATAVPCRRWCYVWSLKLLNKVQEKKAGEGWHGPLQSCSFCSGELSCCQQWSHQKKKLQKVWLYV